MLPTPKLYFELRNMVEQDSAEKYSFAMGFPLTLLSAKVGLSVRNILEQDPSKKYPFSM